MRDGYGREIDYMRISITDRCNLRCCYCMPERIESVDMKELLTYEEIVSVVREAAALGITHIKLTGGEPLVRRGVDVLVRMIKDIDEIEEVTLTTNGVLLEEQIEGLLRAGVGGINISLDTIDPDKYHRITGFDRMDSVMKGIEAALGSGIPVKINAVSLDPDDVEGLIELSKDRPIDIRFIEIMPIGMGKNYPGIPHDELIAQVKGRYGELTPDKSRHGNGPAIYYRIPGYIGSIGFISAIHGKFCDSCNRIRLTSQGFLKNCLCYGTGEDMRKILRSGLEGEALRDELRAGIRRCILSKPEAHAFLQREKISEDKSMSMIGG
ncbi:MAG: GTP 3',8-cyclase MoaA [Eubacterium sp.]|nr:GTP 3',8-cyclase MoaA [Eubacterium sp.]